MRRCVIDCRLMSMEVADWCARRNRRVSRLDAPSTSSNPIRCLMPSRAIDRRLMSMNVTDRRAQCNRRASRLESPRIAKSRLEALHRALSRLDAPSALTNPIRRLMHRCAIDRRLMSMDAADRCTRRNHRVSHVESLCNEASHCASPLALLNPILRRTIDRRLTSMNAADRCARHNRRASHIESPSTSPTPIHRAIDSFNCRLTIDKPR